MKMTAIKRPLTLSQLVASTWPSNSVDHTIRQPSNREDRKLHHCYEQGCKYYNDGTSFSRCIPAPADPPLEIYWGKAQIYGVYEVPEYNIRKA